MRTFKQSNTFVCVTTTFNPVQNKGFMSHLLLFILSFFCLSSLTEKDALVTVSATHVIHASVPNNQQDNDKSIPEEEDLEEKEDLEEEENLEDKDTALVSFLTKIEGLHGVDVWGDMAIDTSYHASSIYVKKVPFYILFVSLRVFC